MPSPTVIKSPHDNDQSWAIEWNLSSGSVRSEPNRRDPVASESATMAAVLCASTLVASRLSRLAAAFSATVFRFSAVPSKPVSYCSPGLEHVARPGLAALRYDAAGTSGRSRSSSRPPAQRSASALEPTLSQIASLFPPDCHGMTTHVWDRSLQDPFLGLRRKPAATQGRTHDRNRSGSKIAATACKPRASEAGRFRSRTLNQLSIPGSAATAGHPRTSRRWGI